MSPPAPSVPFQAPLYRRGAGSGTLSRETLAAVSILRLFLSGNPPAGNTIREHMVGKLSGAQKRSWMTLNKWPKVALEMVSCILGC